ncbi:GPN1 [Enterospora canceri]|uniref:GPN-loop GTPase n=1 Tax=Enterospora canceri TaxID=1081671 RepID=A0A1Y1S6M3_9MICR|nr:GPN1 [Enterospora canceri]
MENKKTFVVVGMAGCGKTTFVQRLTSWIMQHESKEQANPIKSIELVNLDPAVLNTKVPPTIDIRDYVDYKDILIQNNLGSNGAISACLNLFMLKGIKLDTKKYTIIDTPGQIESFIYSAPGDIVFSSLTSQLTILFLIDLSVDSLYSVVSNLIFAGSLASKYNTIIVFTKNDESKIHAISDLFDYDKMRNVTATDDLSEIGTLVTYFEEFYKDIEYVSISSVTGDGKHELIKKLKLF